MDKKFLACLISTKDDELVEHTETKGEVRNIKSLSFIVFLRHVCLFIYLFVHFQLQNRKPVGAGRSTCCT